MLEEDAKYLAALPVTSMGGSGVLLDEPQMSLLSPNFTFEFAKTSREHEVIIDDVILTVVKYEPMPNPFIVTCGAALSDDIKLQYNLRKLEKPLPWKFKPIRATLNKKDFKWGESPLAIRDEFSTRVCVCVDATDPGIYGFTVEMALRAGFGRTSKVSVIDAPVFYGYLGQHEQFALPGQTLFHYSGGRTYTKHIPPLNSDAR